MRWPKNPTIAQARRFWEHQARRLREFRDAPSTSYYREGEQLVIRQSLPPGDGCRILKLDLWNEVKNTDILSWMARRGAHTHAVDVAFPLVREANAHFRTQGLTPRFSVANLYYLPFKSGSFDYVYTMGTIEHAPEMDRCVAEVFRVLKPGGVAVIGVPNKLDPFLRPLLVHLMNLLGVYPYGMEQSLTRRQLSRLLKRQGFEITGHVGILFMPGILRMVELCLYRHCRPLARIVGSLHWPFRLASRALPGVSLHGYLIAGVVRKPR